MQELVFFLHSQSLLTNTFEEYVEGLKRIICIVGQKESSDVFKKNDNDVYSQPFFITLCQKQDQDAGALLSFFQQMPSFPEQINTYKDLIGYISLGLGFVGINFSNLAVNEEEYARDLEEYNNKRFVFLKRKLAENCCIREIFPLVYPWAEFEPQFYIDFEVIQTMGERQTFLDKIFDLIADVKDHPFEFGLGKTEALKGTPKASKRLVGKHRLQYEGIGEKGRFRITRCLEHYT